MGLRPILVQTIAYPNTILLSQRRLTGADEGGVFRLLSKDRSKVQVDVESDYRSEESVRPTGIDALRKERHNGNGSRFLTP
ncbi:hypothetical protein ACYCVF_35930 [Bradyrhizobium sp. 1.29L]